jgi:hypothetical protein
MYGISLLLYPSDLRTEFGQEMVNVFVQQLRDAWRDRGIIGWLDVLVCVGEELFRIACPRRLAAISVPTLGFTASAIVLAVVLGTFGAASVHLLSPICAK